MARSESQGMQIALVVCLLVLLVFIVFTYYFFRQAQEATEMSRKDKEETNKMNVSLRELTDELHKLKVKAGFPETITSAEWEKAADEDMKTYAPTLTAEQRSYREALKQLANALRESSANLAATIADLQAQRDINEKREATKETQIVEFKTKHDEAAKVYAQEQGAFMSDRQRLEREKADLLAANQKAAEEFEQERQATARKIAQLENQLNLVRNQAAHHQEVIAELEGKTQAQPDGTIRRVNQRGMVWIDLGEADFLPRQLSFSVYGVDQNGVARDRRKAAIEVTQLLGAHLAEAKILEDDILNPIVPGDKIYTPLWQPGRQGRFALAGFMDLDGDDLSDRGIIRDMIAMSGGVIDAELDDDGRMQGELTVATRYLIIGDKKNESLESRIGQMRADAKEMGVEIITLANFLERSGWKDTKRVLRFDGSRPEAFTGPPRDGGQPVARGVTSGAFAKRRPRGQINSAYEPPAERTAPAAPAGAPPAARPAAGPAVAEPDDDMPADDSPFDDDNVFDEP